MLLYNFQFFFAIAIIFSQNIKLHESKSSKIETTKKESDS